MADIKINVNECQECGHSEIHHRTKKCDVDGCDCTRTSVY